MHCLSVENATGSQTNVHVWNPSAGPEQVGDTDSEINAFARQRGFSVFSIRLNGIPV